MSRASVDEREAGRFAALAARWWDPDGPFRPLHKLNPARLSYIRDSMIRYFAREPRSLRPFEDLRVLDLGAGGGLTAEPLARLGAGVTGADVAEETVAAARTHAEGMGLVIDYRCATAEELAETGERFDAVLALEVIEHASDPKALLAACRRLVRPDGLFVFSTLSRTAKSFALGIVAAEYLLGWVPRGTHDWRKFLTPEEMRALLEDAGFATRDISGLVYDPLADRWRVSDDTTVNYIGRAVIKARPRSTA